MEINLVELWHQMGWPVRGVVIVLTLQAVACLAVVIDRLWLLFRSRRATSKFIVQAQPLIERSDRTALLELATKDTSSHLARITQAGLRAYEDRMKIAGDHPRALDLAKRAIERRRETLSNAINRGMTVLASTGSTAPFVGLLGTVLGIIQAFKLIARSGSGGLGTIGAAIGEALIVTGYGLCVAIPVVLLFNWLSGKLGDYETSLENAGGELLDRLDMEHIDGAAPARAHSGVAARAGHPHPEPKTVKEAVLAS